MLVACGDSQSLDDHLGSMVSWDGSSWQLEHGSAHASYDGWHQRFTGIDFRGEPIAWVNRDFNVRSSHPLRWNGHEWIAGDPATEGLPITYDDWSMAVDPVRDVIVLFGGRDTSQFSSPPTDELWTFDGASWTR